MIEKLKKYPEYKDSGSSWIGLVPTGWEVRGLSTLIRTRNKRNQPELPLLSVAREKGVFVRGLGSEDENHNVIPEDLTNYKVAMKGDLVINKMKAWQGSMGIAPCDGIVSPAYFVYRFAIENGRFGQALLRSKPYVFHFGRSSDGVRIGQWDLTISEMKRIPVIIPPPNEQAGIVRFLDWANARLDRTIRAKRKVIALLNEQKLAIIHRAVTRGVDYNVRMKDSGIPWLGEIPEHWNVLRAKFLFKEANERSQNGKEELLSVSHITGVTPRSQKNITMFKAQSYVGYKLCKRGDLVVNTMWAWMGALGVSGYSGIVSSAYATYRQIVPESVFGGYLELLLRTKPYIANIICKSTGLTPSRLRLYPEEFFRLPVVLPPIDEQKNILESILTNTAELTKTISRLECEIDLLREYRSRLVADVVTGKLDVREAASHLPSETPEPIETDNDMETEDLDELSPEDIAA